MFNYKIEKLDSINSTNLYAKQNIPSLEDRTVIIAKKQVSGRGRFDRKWIADGTSNAYLSIVLKPNENKYKNYPYQNLTQYLSLILIRVLKNNYNISANIKWPNDVLVEGCKVSGILSEIVNDNNKNSAIILGIGVNLNLKKETIDVINQKATSLNLLLGREIDTQEFIENLLQEFFKGYEDFIEKGFCSIKEEYIEKCSFLGKKVIIKKLNDKIEYIAKSVNQDGTLLVKDENGDKITIMTGDLIC